MAFMDYEKESKVIIEVLRDRRNFQVLLDYGVTEKHFKDNLTKLNRDMFILLDALYKENKEFTDLNLKSKLNLLPNVNYFVQDYDFDTEIRYIRLEVEKTQRDIGFEDYVKEMLARKSRMDYEAFLELELAKLKEGTTDTVKSLNNVKEFVSNVKLPVAQKYNPDKEYEDFFKYLDNRINMAKENDFVSFGFADIDRVIPQLEKKDVYIVGARTGLGKSTFALNVAHHNAIRDKKVMFFTLEEDRFKIYEKLVCLTEDIDKDIMQSYRYNDETWGKISSAIRKDKLALHNLRIIDESRLDINTLRNLMFQQQRDFGLDLVIVDYIGLMQDNTTKNLYERMTHISKEIKSCAMEFNLPIIICAQINRDPDKRENKRPTLSDIRDSGGLEQDATGILLLYRDEYYNPEKLENKGLTEVIIAKNRHGKNGIAKLHFEGEIGMFLNIENIIK